MQMGQDSDLDKINVSWARLPLQILVNTRVR